MSVIQTKSHEPQLEDVLRQIEAESPEAVRMREQSAFDEIAGPFSERLVLFGAGPLGKAVLSGLRKAGVEPLAFTDNKQQLWGQEVSGIPVLSPTDAVRQYCATACFVVTIYQGSSVRRQLSSLGCSRVAPFVPLMWKYADIFIPHSGIELPHNLLRECDAIRTVTASWLTMHPDVSSANNCAGATGWITPHSPCHPMLVIPISRPTCSRQAATMCSSTVELSMETRF